MKHIQHVSHANHKTDFLNVLKRELLTTFKFYLTVITRPSLVVQGFYRFIRDITYKLPKSLIWPRDQHKNLAEKMNEVVSQSLILSEIITIAGTFIGVALLNAFGANDYIASIIGGDVGNYISGALSFILIYNLLSFKCCRTLSKDTFIGSLKIVKDCFPTVVALYIIEAPILAMLLIFGLSLNVAVGLNLIIGMAIFTGMAEFSASQNILPNKSLKR